RRYATEYAAIIHYIMVISGQHLWHCYAILIRMAIHSTTEQTKKAFTVSCLMSHPTKSPQRKRKKRVMINPMRKLKQWGSGLGKGLEKLKKAKDQFHTLS